MNNKETKTICMIVQHAYDADPRVRRKAEALAAAGYSVDVLALRASHGKRKYVLGGVNVYAVSLGKERGSLIRYAFEYVAFFCWAFLSVLWLAPRRRYAIVDVNTLPDFLIFAAWPARWMGATLVLDMHEITPEFFMSKYGVPAHSWTVRLLRFIEKISFRFADHVITVNDPIQQLLVGRGLAPEKSLILMNSVDEDRFKTQAGISPTKDPQTFVMMYHGTLTPIYGLRLAIEALSQVQQEIPQAELWILGSGTERDALAALAVEKGVEQRVKLIGQVPAAEIPSWLMQCDAGILPMRRDVFLDFAFPNKLPEFIVMGKPVLMSRLNAIRYYFSEDALAYFEPNHPADLARQMVRLCRDQGLRLELATRARKEYRAIEWGPMKERYLAFMEEVSGQVRPSEKQRAKAVTTGKA